MIPYFLKFRFQHHMLVSHKDEDESFETNRRGIYVIRLLFEVIASINTKSDSLHTKKDLSF